MAKHNYLTVKIVFKWSNLKLLAVFGTDQAQAKLEADFALILKYPASSWPPPAGQGEKFLI